MADEKVAQNGHIFHSSATFFENSFGFPQQDKDKRIF
jgi:hypothetical protein